MPPAARLRTELAHLVRVAPTAYTPSLHAQKRCAAPTLLWDLCADLGSMFVVVKDVLADVSVFTYLAVRFALAAAVMAIVFLRSLRGLTRGDLGGRADRLFHVRGLRVSTTGLKFTSPSKAGSSWFKRRVIVPLLLVVFGSG